MDEIKITKSSLQANFTGEYIAVANLTEEDIDEQQVIANNVEKEIESFDTSQS